MELTSAQSRSAAIVFACEGFKPGMLSGGQRERIRMQVMGSTERARSEWEFHGAAPLREGGERSWSWAAVHV